MHARLPGRRDGVASPPTVASAAPAAVCREPLAGGALALAGSSVAFVRARGSRSADLGPLADKSTLRPPRGRSLSVEVGRRGPSCSVRVVPFKSQRARRRHRQCAICGGRLPPFRQRAHRQAPNETSMSAWRSHAVDRPLPSGVQARIFEKQQEKNLYAKKVLAFFEAAETSGDGACWA